MKGIKKVAKMYAFDSDGRMIKENFDTPHEAERFAKNHGLTVFRLSDE